MNARGYYGGYYVGAETTPVRQILIDSLEKLQRDREALVAKIQQYEARLKVALESQKGFERPFASDVLRLQYEALQNESSTLANDVFAAKRSLAYVDGQIKEVSTRIERATGKPPQVSPPRPPPSPPRPSREDVRRPPKEEAPAKVPVEPMPAETPPLIGTGVILAGAAAVALLIGVVAFAGKEA